jgi:hypothetical protein
LLNAIFQGSYVVSARMACRAFRRRRPLARYAWLATGLARLPLIERKELLKPLIPGIPGLQFNGHEIGDGGAYPRARLPTWA